SAVAVSFITSLVRVGDRGDRCPSLSLGLQADGYPSQQVRAWIALSSFDPREPSRRDADQLGEAREAEAALFALAADPVSSRLHIARLGKVRQARQGMETQD